MYIMGACCGPQGKVSFDLHDEPIDNTPIPDGTEDSPPPANSIDNYFTVDQWRRRIIMNEDVVIVYDIADEYESFINKLAYPTQWNSPFYISIIIRVINHYIGNDANQSSLLCKKESQLFEGLKLTSPILTINPINGKIYLCDGEYTIFYLDESDNKHLDDKRLKKVCSIPNHFDLNHDVKLTNIAFNSDGESLFAMINNNMDKIYYVNLPNKKIFYDKIYDKSMDILRYNFNEYYLTSKWLPQFFLEVVNTIIPNSYRSTEVEDAYNNQNSLYRLDSYRKYLWILQNNEIDKEATRTANNSRVDGNDDDNEQLNDQRQHFGDQTIVYQILPTLYRIPIEYANILRQIKQLQMDRILKQRSSNLMDDSMEFGRKKQILEDELEEQSRYGEIIKLIDLLQLERNVYIIAFDIDRYYESFYFVTNEYTLYRIEKILGCKSWNKQIVRKKGKGNMARMSRKSINEQSEFYESKFKIKNKGWQVTHKLNLKDVLFNGLPSGKCTICYDSVNGRLIVADNYKVQTLYI